MRYGATLLIILSLLASCSTVLPESSAYKAVAGTWRLYESGNNPSGGFDYVVKSVSASSSQTIKLKANGRFKADGYDPLFVSLYTPIRAYRVEKIATDTHIYSFIYRDKRRGKGQYSEVRQGLILKNDTLRLNPSCVEGCHFSFVKVK